MSPAVWLALPNLPRDDLALRLVFFLIPLLGGLLSFLSSDCTSSASSWRASLRKSRLCPPPSVAGVVWTVVYLAMGHASYLAYSRHAPRRVLSGPLLAYLAHCLLNHFSVIVLFGLQRIDLALFMSLALWTSAAVTVVLFYDACLVAGRLMGLVLAWISFNVYLNVVLFLKNPVYTEMDLRQGYRPEWLQRDVDKRKRL